MLCGARRELCREPRAAEVVDFVGVYLRVEAHLLRGLEQPAALVYGEYALLAEYVAELRYALFLDLRQHLLDEHFVDELVGAALVFLRHGVRAHEGRHYVERRFASDAAYNFEHFQLEAELEAVAALYLDGGRSLRESGERKLFRRLEKLLLRRGLYGVDRGEYAAAAREYLKVGKSRKAHPELVLAALREAHVRVRVDEAGDDAGPAEVLFYRYLAGADVFEDFFLFAYFLYDSAADEHRGFFDFLDVGLLFARERMSAVDGGEEAHVAVKFFRTHYSASFPISSSRRSSSTCSGSKPAIWR